MKVLMFMTDFHRPSGAELSVMELAEELNMRGIHTDILSMYTEDLPGVPEATQRLLETGIPSVHFLGMRVHPSIASMIPAIRRLRRLVREQGYDVVETSMLSPSVIASWALRGVDVAHVVGIRHVYQRGRENSKQHKFFRLSVRYNSRIRYYAISDYGREHWIEYSGTLPENSRRVYNSIPDSFFSVSPDRLGVRQELGIPRDARIAIYVGRYAAYKGIDTLLCALGPVLAHHNMYLLYVGSPDLSVAGTGEMLQRMETRIAHEKWSEEVRFLGRREDVPRLLASADILVHPTRTEAFGRTLAEALAVGLPVAASNVEAVSEVLAETDSIMVPPDNPEALREAVFELLKRTPDEADRASEKARARAQEFQIGKRTDAMIQLFQDVLDRRF